MIAPSMSRLANQLLSGQIGDLGRIARSRQRHQLFWDALLSKDELSEKGSLILAERSEGRTWTPYLGAYQINTNSSADSVFKLMEIRGLPVTTWPDLPPEVKHFKERHANAWHLRHSRIYLPVHQTLQTAKMFKNNSYREELEETKKKSNQLNESTNPVGDYLKQDEEVRLLAYKLMIDKFNEKYNNLSAKQKNILKEYINNVSNNTTLKDFVIREALDVRLALSKLAKNVTDKVTKIKLNEAINLTKKYEKIKNIQEENVLSLLLYHELIKELSDATKG